MVQSATLSRIYILKMASDEFDELVLSKLATTLRGVVNSYAKREYNGLYYSVGIYIYTKHRDTSHDIYLTFLANEGEKSSLDFMLSERRDINIIIDCLTSDKFQHLTVSKTVSSWTLYDCDILTKCRHIGQHGVLVRNGKTESDSIYKVEE